MSSGQDAIFAVREERARIGGVEVAKKTVIAATDEGIVQTESIIRQPASINFPGSSVTTEIHTVETVRSPVIQPALPAPQPVVVVPPRERTWVDWCFEWDDGYSWYDLHGKGICWVLILLLCYLVAGTVVIVLGLAWCVCKCIAIFSDD